MALKKKLNFLWTLALYLIATRLPKAFGNDLPRVPSILDPKFIDAFLNIHNELRRKVQPPAADMNQVMRKKRNSVQNNESMQGREMKHGLPRQEFVLTC